MPDNLPSIAGMSNVPNAPFDRPVADLASDNESGSDGGAGDGALAWSKMFDCSPLLCRATLSPDGPGSAWLN
jgi:hypothetical protein